MSKRIPRLELDQLPADLAAALKPRVERLGYLGEFFKCAAQQPAALRSFMQFTDDLKQALPDDVTEAVALTVATSYDNDYERHQHERLCRKLGFSEAWVREVEALAPDAAGELTPAQRAAQRLTLAVLARRGRGVEPVFEELLDAVGTAQAVAVLLLIGRYVTHSLVVNALGLAPPVSSIFTETKSAKKARALWIAEHEVRALLGFDDAIGALENGLRREARATAHNMAKTHATWGRGNTLHAIGAVFPAEGVAGTKTWAHTENGAGPVFALFDANDGALLAMIEAFSLGQLRTGGISAVATRWLAAESADELAVIGSGKQALMQVRAVAAVRRLRRVRVFSPTAAHREAFADEVRRELGLEVEAATSVPAAVAGAPIVTLVTRATEPFLEVEMVAAGAHVNAVGAITLNRAEFAPQLLSRCRSVVADSVEAVRALSREFRAHYDSRGGWDEVLPLAAIVDRGPERPKDGDITLFKAMGMGISDLSLGLEVYRRARERAVGREI